MRREGGTRVSNRIRALRGEAGLTQLELAQRVGASRQTVVAIENGKYAPTLELAFRIAGALGVEIGGVFSYGGDGVG